MIFVLRYEVYFSVVLGSEFDKQTQLANFVHSTRLMMMMMMMIVDLYSALRRAPLQRYVSRCIVKRNVFSADQKDPMLSDGSQR